MDNALLTVATNTAHETIQVLRRSEIERLPRRHRRGEISRHGESVTVSEREQELIRNCQFRIGFTSFIERRPSLANSNEAWIVSG